MSDYHPVQPNYVLSIINIDFRIGYPLPQYRSAVGEGKHYDKCLEIRE